jgi:hypothetical protein
MFNYDILKKINPNDIEVSELKYSGIPTEQN